MENLPHQINDSGDALSLSLSLSLSQKYTIIYLSNNSESEYLKKETNFFQIPFNYLVRIFCFLISVDFFYEKKA
jgi:hypothetical protein